jgi:hypothetical protein
VDFWKRCYELTPRVDPGFQGFMEWRELDEKPADEVAAKDFLKAMIAGRVARLEEMIALHEEISGKDAIELADAASFDPGPTGEKLRRREGALARELKQTLELLLKLQKHAERVKRPAEGKPPVKQPAIFSAPKCESSPRPEQSPARPVPRPDTNAETPKSPHPRRPSRRVTRANPYPPGTVENLLAGELTRALLDKLESTQVPASQDQAGSNAIPVPPVACACEAPRPPPCELSER